MLSKLAAHPDKPPVSERVWMCYDENHVLKLLEKGAAVNVPDGCGYTPLMLAAMDGNHKHVDALIKAGADVNARNFNGSTALSVAMRKKKKTCVELLLEAGSDLGGPGAWNRMLKGALEMENSAWVGLLVQAGAHVDWLGAVYKHDHYITRLKMLLKAGARVNAASEPYRPFKNPLKLLGDKSLALYIAAGMTVKFPQTFRRSSEFSMDLLGSGFPGVNLRDLCRKRIRERLLELSPVNLFCTVLELPLPPFLSGYLVYGMTLEEEEEEDGRSSYDYVNEDMAREVRLRMTR